MAGRNRAYILVEVMVVVAFLVAFIAMLVADQRSMFQETQNLLRQRRAEMAARSAVAMAMETLASVDTSMAQQSDDWYTLDERGDETFTMDVSSYRYEVVDGGSLLNVNTATEAQLDLLPLDQGQIDCLLDWRETGTQPRADGAKDEYYTNLKNPYNARENNLQLVSELLLVKGWTGQMIYTTTDTTQSSNTLEDVNGNPLELAAILTVNSGAPNTKADGTARTNVSSATVNPNVYQQMGINPTTAQLLSTRGPFTNFSQLLGVPGLSSDEQTALLNNVTFGNSRWLGKLNLNTVSKAVLMTVPNMSSSIADAIVAQQSSGFTSLGDLATISGVSGDTLAQLADFFTVGSDTFIIRAYGESGGVGQAYEVTIQINSGTPTVLSWVRMPGTKPPAWWHWNEQASYTSEVGSE